MQSEMVASLSSARKNVSHPGAKGDVSELRWKEMLQTYLPTKYSVEKGFVLDSYGALSDEIDLVIFDRHHSPNLFMQRGAIYVPAESVYAVVEVKQDLCKHVIGYADQKAESVRRLRRTSAPVRYAGGTYAPRKPFAILAGVIALGCEWTPPLGKRLTSALSQLKPTQRLDLGCALQHGAFEVRYTRGGRIVLDACARENALMHFFLCLLRRLQQLATAPAIDYGEYAKLLPVGRVGGQPEDDRGKR